MIIKRKEAAISWGFFIAPMEDLILDERSLVISHIYAHVVSMCSSSS